MIKFIRTSDHDLPIPKRGTSKSVGFDLCCAEEFTIWPMQRLLVHTGWSWDIWDLDGVYGRIAPRSGMAVKHGFDVLAGVVDADYQGEIKVLLINFGDRSVTIEKGSKIAQLILESHIADDVEVTEAKVHGRFSDRGIGGFGSTGK